MANFPKPYVDDVKQDDSTMRYVNGGDFSKAEIGATSQGIAKDIKTERMGIKHVGDMK